MIYQGRVRDGVVVLPPGVELPEGSFVTVEPVREESRSKSSASSRLVMRNGVPVFPRLRERPRPGLEIVNSLRDES